MIQVTEAFRHQASLGWVWLAACIHTLLPSVGALAVQFQLYSMSENLRTDLGPPLRKVPEPLQHHPLPSPGCTQPLRGLLSHCLLQFTRHWSLTKIILSSSPGQRRGKVQTMPPTAPQVQLGWGSDMRPPWT